MILWLEWLDCLFPSPSATSAITSSAIQACHMQICTFLSADSDDTRIWRNEANSTVPLLSLERRSFQASADGRSSTTSLSGQLHEKMSCHFSQHSNTKVLLLLQPAAVLSKINGFLFMSKTIGLIEAAQRGKGLWRCSCLQLFCAEIPIHVNQCVIRRVTVSSVCLLCSGLRSSSSGEFTIMCVSLRVTSNLQAFKARPEWLNM